MELYRLLNGTLTDKKSPVADEIFVNFFRERVNISNKTLRLYEEF